METFIVNGKEFKMATKWDEITLRQYISICKLEENKELYPIPEYLGLKRIEILCNAQDGELDELPLSEWERINTGLNDLLNHKPEPRLVDHVNINGVDYSTKRITNLFELTSGEYISIKTIQKQSDSVYDTIHKVLAVLIRPATKNVDHETGKEEWVVEKFDTKNLEYRAELFLDNLNATISFTSLDFFLNGSNS
ncbi:MAG: hypothetical protein EOO06_00325 [Chitinophagaceae bacterium]|nr:MAG: hypothetical protein EOO06_00325 [Chitinophagaceae bacterium]